MLRVQEEPIRKYILRIGKSVLTIIDSFREWMADLWSGVKPPWRVRKSKWAPPLTNVIIIDRGSSKSRHAHDNAVSRKNTEFLRVSIDDPTYHHWKYEHLDRNLYLNIEQLSKLDLSWYNRRIFWYWSIYISIRLKFVHSISTYFWIDIFLYKMNRFINSSFVFKLNSNHWNLPSRYTAFFLPREN